MKKVILSDTESWVICTELREGVSRLLKSREKEYKKQNYKSVIEHDATIEFYNKLIEKIGSEQ